VKIEIRQTYPLAEAAQAHLDLESRKTIGSTILLPD
jgi:NADPH2:quinone reductase